MAGTALAPCALTWYAQVVGLDQVTTCVEIEEASVEEEREPRLVGHTALAVGAPRGTNLSALSAALKLGNTTPMSAFRRVTRNLKRYSVRNLAKHNDFR